MPLPKFTPAESITPASEQDHNHYFDAAHGDVAALHARIERGFVDHPLGLLPHGPFEDRLDRSIHLLSRTAGIVGFIGALGAIAYALI